MNILFYVARVLIYNTPDEPQLIISHNISPFEFIRVYENKRVTWKPASMLYLLLFFGVLMASHSPPRPRICPVCYDIPCVGTDKSLLYCATDASASSCTPCNTTCLQCNNTSDSPYVCQCPAPYPTRSPTPPTKAPTVTPTRAPTEEPTGAPTNEPTYAPTPPLPPVVILFSPTRAPIAPTPSPTRTPTRMPTRTPTTTPTRAPTPRPPTFNECRLCTSSLPPTSRPCNDSHSKLRLMCRAYDNVTCVFCPPYCSFCYPLLAPSPSYVCTCPLTSAPTPAPTPAPTMAPTASPTSAPTKQLPDLVSADTIDRATTIAIQTVLVAFGCIIVIITVLFCCVTPNSLLIGRGRHDHDL